MMELYKKTQWEPGNTTIQKNTGPRGTGVATTCAAGFGEGI